MFLHLLATVRPTESWAPFHVIAVIVVALAVYLLVRAVRVRGSR